MIYDSASRRSEGARDSLTRRLIEGRRPAQPQSRQPSATERSTTPLESLGSGKSALDRNTAESRSLLGRLRESQQRYSPGKNRQDSDVQLEAGRPNVAISRTPSETQLRERIRERRADSTAAGRAMPSAANSPERVRIAGSEIQDRRGLLPRLRDYARRTGGPVTSDAGRLADYAERRPRVVYHDRPDLARYSPHNVYTYRDRYDRLCHRIIWPRFYYPVYYSYGPYFGFRCVYPFYHRKYVFVSLGGFWPLNYTYLRYYHYGWHPFTWSGYYPIPREVDGDTYSYYTYNYYINDNGSYTDSGSLPYGIDAETYARVQQRVAEQQAKEPSAQTRTDVLFEGGVKDFEAGSYDDAVTQFAAAMELAPDDMILPYAYAQALFASGQYSKAAEVLRGALQNVSPAEEGVFYPRGLYPDDDTLFEQIEDLLDEIEDYGFDADMQLLLGYNLLGIGETEYARGPLERAGEDARNARAAKVLLSLVKKLEAVVTTENGGAQAQSDAARAAVQTPSEDEAKVSRKRVDVLDRIKTTTPPNAVTPQAEADTDSASPNIPTESEPSGEPENLGVGSEAGSVGVVGDDSGWPGSGPPAGQQEPGHSGLTAVLMNRSATPAMFVLLGGATLSLVHADKLYRLRASG